VRALELVGQSQRNISMVATCSALGGLVAHLDGKAQSAHPPCQSQLAMIALALFVVQACARAPPAALATAGLARVWKLSTCRESSRARGLCPSELPSAPIPPSQRLGEIGF